MASLSKKLTAVLFAVTAALCLSLGLLFTVQKTSAFAEDENTATLSEATYFVYSDSAKEVLCGLSDTGIAEAGDKNIIINIPSTVKEIAASNSTSEGILGNLSGKLVGLTVPSSVTKIGAYAFYGSANLEKLDLASASALTEIGESAFNSGLATGYSSTLKTVTVPEKVNTIGNLAFANRTGLTAVNFYATACNDFSSNSAENPFYRAGALSGTKVTVNIGSTNPVTKIPANMFLNDATRAHRITYVNFLNANIAAESFGANAFSGCRLLESVDFGSSTIAEIGGSAFKGCTALGTITLPSSCSKVGVSAFQGCTALTSVTFGNNLLVIGDDSFNGCTSLGNVAIPSVTIEIGDRAFNGCSSFTEITVPAGVQTIGTNAFSNCTSAKTINYYAKAASFSSSQTTTSPFSNGANNVKLVIGTTSAAITSLPSHLFRSSSQNVLRISEVEFINVNLGTEGFGNNLFTSCTSLTSVEFTNCTIPVINYGAFYGCTSLGSIDLSGAKVETIAEQAFYGCTSLSDIDLPDILKVIEKQAFYNCSGLYSIAVPSNVTTIGDSAFENCIRLIEVKTDLTVEKGSSDYGCLAKYALNVYKDGEGNIKQPDANGFVFYSGDDKVYLITYVGGETNLSLPANYENKSYIIYSRAFSDNKNITSVSFASGTVMVTEIQDQAFSGCTSLTSVDLTNGPASMGDYVFQGCTSLSQVKLPANLNAVGMYAFYGCTALSEIEIPANVAGIKTNAFQNCTSLKKVTFASQSKLSYIYGSAFQNCSSLAVIRIPASVTVIQGSAFADCANLRTVYLPTTLTTVGNNVFPVSTGLILIAPDKDSYEAYLDGNLSGYRNNLTYQVAINLFYECYEHGSQGTGAHDVAYRLFGRSYELVEQDDCTWLANGGLPVQHGYSVSVWYQYSDYSGEVITGDWLTARLSLGSEINLYAKTYGSPKLTVKENLSYNSTKSPSWVDFVNETLNPDIYRVEISEYKTYYTNESKTVPSGSLEAGYYTLSVTIAEEYGVWATPYNVTATVEPMSVDAAFWANWVQLTGAPGSYTGVSLAPRNDAGTAVKTTLYIYEDGQGNETPYLEKQNGEPKRTVSVLASYVSLTGNTVTIVLDGDSRYFGESQYYTVEGSYTANSSNRAGVYGAYVNIAANNNYSFLTEEVADLGLRVTHTPNTNIYTVYKTWYIAVNHSNSPLLGNTDYVVDGWTYNSGKAPAAPSLISGYEDRLITFSLYRYSDNKFANDVISGMIVSNASYSDFEYYVNSSMPAGTYILTLYVDDYVAGNMAGGTYPYEFTVNYGFVTGNLYGDLANHKDIVYAMSHAYDGGIYLGDTSSVTVTQKEISELHPDPVGFWALPANSYMYQGFGITYEIVAAVFNSDGSVSYPSSSGNYYTEEEYLEMHKSGTSVTLPENIGLYRVYYNISAPSYKGLFEDVNVQSQRENYFYTVKIYGVVSKDQLPQISTVEFAGENKSVTPVVTDKNGWFDVHYLDPTVRGFSASAVAVVGEEEYVNAGSHTLALTIRSAYRSAGLLVWGDGIETKYNDNRTIAYALVQFTITPSQNKAGSLNLTTWNWGKFDSQTNRPAWSTAFVDYDGFTFTLTSSNGEVYTYGDTDGAGFQNANAGTYTLKATAEGNTLNGDVTGYNWYECSSEITVTILPAVITWDIAPFVASWKYGEYSNMYVVREGALNSSYGNLASQMNVYFCLASDINDYSKHYNSIGLLMKDGEVPAGDYALVYELDKTDNYDKWVYPVLFSVLKADNYWDVTPTITSWYYGDTTIDYKTYKPEYAPHVGNASDVIIEYRILDENYKEVGGWESTLEALGLDTKNNLPVGNYELRATLPETENYESMVFSMRFKVAKAQNSWKDIPGVVNWSEGRWSSDKNMFTATDLYNSTVYITIEDAKGNVLISKQKIDELNVNILKSLSAGSYKMIAYVNETTDYEGLETEAYFAVLEDSIGMSGLIAATMVFAVIAIGLAVAGVVLLIRRNKKIDEEFRNYIKSELNRR